MSRTMLAVFLLVTSLAAHAQSNSGSYLNLGAVKLWYQECGSSGAEASRNVVLLHDGLIHSATWDDEWPALCSRYHVLRYDRRGYGRSDVSPARYVPEDDLFAVMQHAKMGRAIIVGNSSGAGLAVDFALAYPDMVGGLILIGPVVHGMSSSRFANERGARNNSPLDNGKNDYKAAAENWSKDQFLIAGNNDAARKKIYDALVEFPRNLTACCGMEIRPSPPASTRLSQVQAPTLLLVGSADLPDVHTYAGAIEVSLPVVLREVWKDAGHYIQLEKPDDLVKRIDRFSARIALKEVSLPPTALESCAGQYRIAPGLNSRITVDHQYLRLEAPGFAYQRLFAASPTQFFTRSVEWEIHFEKAANGAVSEIVIHNPDGSMVRWPRV
jgi:3-oxoadipate enol-lactonase